VEDNAAETKINEEPPLVAERDIAVEDRSDGIVKTPGPCRYFLGGKAITEEEYFAEQGRRKALAS
jgi:hypothetical protein